MRKECPEISWGDWKILKARAPEVLIMRYEWENQKLLIAHNFSPKPRAFTLDADVVGGRQLVNLLTREDCQADENGRLHLELDGYGYLWFSAGGIDRNVPRP
jgi:maltose alpha-D-glucosyltransferase/alpha-amylase